MSLFGILIGLAGLMYACMRGLSILVAAPLFAMIVAATGGMNVVDAILTTFMKGAAGFAQKFFILFLLGAIFGKIMENTGAATAVGNWVTDKVGAKRAVLAVVLGCGVLAYGGVSVFVVVFTMYPLAMGMFKRADLPKRLIPGTLALGSFTFAMTALPGTPQIQNIIPTKYFDSTPQSAPVLGVICGILVLGAGMWYLNREAKKAKEAGEGFNISQEESEKYEQVNSEELPSFGLAILPLITVVVLLNIVGLNINVSLFFGILLAIGLFYKRLDGVSHLVDSINEGANGSIKAIMNTSIAVGFGTIVRSAPGFDVLVDGLTKVTMGNSYLYAAISTNILAGATGSASGGMGIALEALGQQYIVMGGNPDLLHRIVAVASGGLDALPHNGAIVTLLVICGLTHKQSYKDIFMVAVAFPFIVGMIAVALASMGIFA